AARRRLGTDRVGGVDLDVVGRDVQSFGVGPRFGLRLAVCFARGFARRGRLTWRSRLARRDRLARRRGRGGGRHFGLGDFDGRLALGARPLLARELVADLETGLTAWTRNRNRHAQSLLAKTRTARTGA